MSDDIRELIKDMLEAEEFMLNLYKKCCAETKNKKIAKVLELIAQDEKKHAENAKMMLKIVDE